jgi:hypothetical protein
LVLAGVGLVVYCWRSILSTIATKASRTGEKPVAKKRSVEMFAGMFSGTSLDEPAAIGGKISLL